MTSQAPQPTNELSLLELHEMYEVGGVEPALTDALRYCRDHLEPRWVFDGALEMIGKLSAESPSGAGGRHANPRTRRVDEEREYVRWKIVARLREAGLSLDQAIDAALPALAAASASASHRTILRSYRRIEKARAGAMRETTAS